MSNHDHGSRQSRPQPNPQSSASQHQPPPPPLHPVASGLHRYGMAPAPLVPVLLKMKPDPGPPTKFEHYLERSNQRLPGGDPLHGHPRHENQISNPHLPADTVPSGHETLLPLSHDDSSSRPRTTVDQPVNNPNAVSVPDPTIPRASHIALYPPIEHYMFLRSTCRTQAPVSESFDNNKPSRSQTQERSMISAADTVEAEDSSPNPNCKWWPKCHGSDKSDFCPTCKTEGYHADLARIEARYSGIIEELDKRMAECTDRSAWGKYDMMTRDAKAQREAAKAKWYP